MKRIGLGLLAVLAISACREQGPVVDAGDSGLAARNNLVLYKNKPFTGVVKSFIPAMGEVEFTEYKLGFQHGLTRTETLDGKLLGERPYFAGAKHGIHKTWDKNGQLRTYAQFQMGNYVGEAWSWYPDGKPYDYKKYNEKGELLIARMWRPTGQIYLNQVFHNGVAIGMPGSKLCDPSGVQTAEAEKAREDRSEKQ